MKIFEKIRSYLFGSYAEWFGDQITNNGQGFAYVDRKLEQDIESKEIRLTLTLFDAAYSCGIEVEIEKILVAKLGIGMPTGFQQIDLQPEGRYKDDPAEIRFCKKFNKTHVHWVADYGLEPNIPQTIIFPVEHLDGYGQITIGLPFKLGFGGGILNANTLVGLGNPEEIENQIERWKDQKTIWLKNRNDSTS